MKPLGEIHSFPKPLRDILETQFGITSAEAFFEHAVRNATGISQALQVPVDDLDPLKKLVEGHLSPAFVARCRQPVKKHSRGVIVD